MPITKSAKKSLKVSETKRARNLYQKIGLEKGLRQATKENLPKVVSLVDKAAKTGIIHKNKAARIKSKLMKRFAGDEVASPKVKKSVKPKTKKAVTKKKTVSKKK